MKIKIFIYTLLLTGFLHAQLYVGSNNSFVTVNNAFLFSNGAINLNHATQSNIYLRRDGQLFQGGTTSTNTGAGKLSVYQEGTSSAYQHNAWCSPVGDPSDSQNRFGITLLNRPTSFSASSPVTTTTAHNGTTSNSSLVVSSRWISTYNNHHSYQGWVRHNAATTIQPGFGFTMKGSGGTDSTEPFTGAGANNPGNAQRYDFRGRPNNGDFTFSIDVSLPDGTPSTSTAGRKRTLVGNPYPSAIDLAYFVYYNSISTAENAYPALNGVVYFWEQANIISHYLTAYQGGYGTWVPGVAYNTSLSMADNLALVGQGVYVQPDYKLYNSDGTVNDPNNNVGTGTFVQRRYSPIGQGFMVQSKPTPEFTGSRNFYMKNDFRIFIREGAANFSEFRSNSSNACNQNFDAIPNMAGFDYSTFKKVGPAQIKLSTIINDDIVLPTVITFHESSTDNFDLCADAPKSSGGNFNFYFHPNDDVNNALVIYSTSFDFGKRIPVAFKNTDIESTFVVKVNQILNCFDASIPVYLFDNETNEYHDIKNGEAILTLPIGTHLGRFEIVFENQTLSSTIVAENYGFVITHNNDNKEIVIHNTKRLDLANFEMFDLTGKKVIEKSSLGSETKYNFSTADFQTATYLIKLTTVNKEIIKGKVIVKN